MSETNAKGVLAVSLVHQTDFLGRLAGIILDVKTRQDHVDDQSGGLVRRVGVITEPLFTACELIVKDDLEQ